jgi:hypothetical protein
MLEFVGLDLWELRPARDLKACGLLSIAHGVLLPQQDSHLVMNPRQAVGYGFVGGRPCGRMMTMWELRPARNLNACGLLGIAHGVLFPHQDGHSAFCQDF